jgi:hypothetical protein
MLIGKLGNKLLDIFKEFMEISAQNIIIIFKKYIRGKNSDKN